MRLIKGFQQHNRMKFYFTFSLRRIILFLAVICLLHYVFPVTGFLHTENQSTFHSIHDSQYQSIRLLNETDTSFLFSVIPTNCTISPEPTLDSFIAEVETSIKYFFVKCPLGFKSATIHFPVFADYVMVAGTPNKQTQHHNLTSLTISNQRNVNSDSSVSSPDLYLCRNITNIQTCRHFQIKVNFASAQEPLLDSIFFLPAPEINTNVFDPWHNEYKVKLFSNVLVSVGIKGNAKNHILVDSRSPILPTGFLESSYIFKYRPQAYPGTSENFTVFATNPDRSQIKPYTVIVTTIPSQESRLERLIVSPGRLEPLFQSNIYSYLARIPPGLRDFTIQLEALDNKDTRCGIIWKNKQYNVNEKKTFLLPLFPDPWKRTLLIQCIAADTSYETHYTITFVTQKGGDTILSHLSVGNGHFNREFNSNFHGPYVAEFSKYPKNNGWIELTAETPNSDALITIDSIPINRQTGKSSWMYVPIGEQHMFRISVQTKENHISEDYTVIVDRRTRWKDSKLFANCIATFLGYTSVIVSATSGSAFLQNMQFLQFLSLTNRINGKPESFDAFSETFNPWNFQWDTSWIVHSKKKIVLFNSLNYSASIPLEDVPIDDINYPITESTNSITTSVSTRYPLLQKELSVIVGNQLLAPQPEHPNPNVLLSRQQDTVTYQTIDAIYKSIKALESYISSLIIISCSFMIIGVIYLCAVSLFVSNGIKDSKGRVRNMPMMLHPIRFWGILLDIAMMPYIQACVGIIMIPHYLRQHSIIVFNVFSCTVNQLTMFMGILLLIIPLIYFTFLSWALYRVRQQVKFLKDINKYQNPNVYFVKAQYKLLEWFPILSQLLSIEIRNVAPIFQPSNYNLYEQDTWTDSTHRPSIQFTEEKHSYLNLSSIPALQSRSSGYQSQSDDVSCRTKPNELHYRMLPHNISSQTNDKELIKYCSKNDLLKVSLGGLRGSYVFDNENTLLYGKYPNALIGNKIYTIKNLYGYKLNCYADLELQHLSNIWQMGELPHHFHLWIPRQHCETPEIDGWLFFFEHHQQGNFFQHLINKLVYFSILLIIVLWGETSGSVTPFIISTFYCLLSIFYTPTAISSGNAHWAYQQTQKVLQSEKNKKMNTEQDMYKQQWPYNTVDAQKQLFIMQQFREKLNWFGHGGWCIRHPWFGIPQFKLWSSCHWMRVNTFLKGPAGIELMKCLIMLSIGLGNSSIGLISSSTSSLFGMLMSCVCLICLNYHCIKEFSNQIVHFLIYISQIVEIVIVWCMTCFNDLSLLQLKVEYLLVSCIRRLVYHEPFETYDYPGDIGNYVRTFPISECQIIADEVGIFMKGKTEPNVFTQYISKSIGSLDEHEYRLEKTLYQLGPIGTCRSAMMKSMPIRLGFQDFYHGKRETRKTLIGTIQIVNHGYRLPKRPQLSHSPFTEKDDSYLSLYTNPILIPECGVSEEYLKHKHHGYVIRYNKDQHCLFIRGPCLQETVQYTITTQSSIIQNQPTQVIDKKNEIDNDSHFLIHYPDTQTMISLNGNQCEGHVSCLSPGVLFIDIPHIYKPSLTDLFTVKTPERSTISINPNEIKVTYDSIQQRLTLRHRLLRTSSSYTDTSGGLYTIIWNLDATKKTHVEETVTCHTNGLLYVPLSKSGVPNLDTSIIIKNTMNQTRITIDPKETDDYRLMLTQSKEPTGYHLIPFKAVAKLYSVFRRIYSRELPVITLDDFWIQCTIIQCVDPKRRLYRVEPNFEEYVCNIRSQIHIIEAELLELDSVERLGISWSKVLSLKEFHLFWKKNGVRINNWCGIWVNPLSDITHPLVKSQNKLIQKAIPSFRIIIKSLYSAKLRQLESMLHDGEIWLRGYNDIELYKAQWIKDITENCMSPTNLEFNQCIKELKQRKSQYQNALKHFIYPYVVSHTFLSKKPNITCQLREWEQQIISWFKSDGDISVIKANQIDCHSSTKIIQHIMYRLQDHLNHNEDLSKNHFRTLCHFIFDSIHIRGISLNWNPDPIGGHMALVRLWRPNKHGLPDFSQDPVWNPCCLKLCGTSLKILFPGKDDIQFQFNTPNYWSHVLGHFIELPCFEKFNVYKNTNLPTGYNSNVMLHGMPGELICHLTSKLHHVNDQHIRLIETGAPCREILMRPDRLNNDLHQLEVENDSPRSIEGEWFLISLGKRIITDEIHLYPSNEVQIGDHHAQVYPLMFRFPERFLTKWETVIQSAQMDEPALTIDTSFGLVTETESVQSSEDAEITQETDINHNQDEYDHIEKSRDIILSDEVMEQENNQVMYSGSWDNYRFNGFGTLKDLNGTMIYSGDWKNGLRWGNGECCYKDSKGIEWSYQGQFINDQICGIGTLKLVDKNELYRLKNHPTINTNNRLIQFKGKFQPMVGSNTFLHESVTIPLESKRPNISPQLLLQLFKTDPSKNKEEKSLVIDIRRAISCEGGDLKMMTSTLNHHIFNQQTDVDSTLLATLRDEYLPHKARWIQQFDPSISYVGTNSRTMLGTAYYGNGTIYTGELNNDYLPHGNGCYMTIKEDVKYKGEFINGKPNGHGVLSIKSIKDNQTHCYYGCFKNGLRHDYGIQMISNNHIYIDGLWENDKLKNESDVIIVSNVNPINSSFEQEYPHLIAYSGKVNNNNVPDGIGRIIWNDGIIYEGTFHEGNRHGIGKMTDESNNILINTMWKNDKPHGKIISLLLPNNYKYTGDMFEGVRQGMGKLYEGTNNRLVYEGLWRNNKPHGRGTLYHNEGVYEGDFVNGERSGKGTICFAKTNLSNTMKRLYEGDWKDDLPHGVGFYKNGVDPGHTYKFIKGEIDKTSLIAYKSGICKKLPMVEFPSITRASSIFQTLIQSSHLYGTKRLLSDSIFINFCGNLQEPYWDQHVLNKTIFSVTDLSESHPYPLEPSHLIPPVKLIYEKNVPVISYLPPVSTNIIRQFKITFAKALQLTLPDITQPGQLFIQVVYADQTTKTTLLPKKVNFVWNAQIIHQLTEQTKLKVELWEEDNHSVAHFIGSGELNIGNFLIHHLNNFNNIEISLSSAGNNQQSSIIGTLLVNFEICQEENKTLQQ